MTTGQMTLIVSLAVASAASPVAGQTSSLGQRQKQAQATKVTDVAVREAPRDRRNVVYDLHSWISIPPQAPKRFKVGDLLTIIVRERRSFEAEADLETKRRYSVKSDLDAFIKLTAGGVGASAFRRGSPSIDLSYLDRLKGEGDAEREDRLTTRLTGKIIDVKPNGLLVMEARASILHDEEHSAITFTGTCRKEDVTADNTILSTQVADKTIVIDNRGALRAASSRGWLLRIIDKLKPL